MTNQFKSTALVGIQLAALAWLALTGPVIATHPLPLLMELAGGVVGIWALWTMGFRQLRIGPEVAPAARFIAQGPYRWIRHPMYTSVLLLTLSVLWNHFTWVRLVVWLVLLANLLVKIRVEEFLLLQRFSEYTQYRERTKRLVPLIY